MNNRENLNNVIPGEYAVIDQLNACGGMRRRLLDIGLCEDTVIKCVGCSPFGDPKAFLIRGAVIAIRSEDCADIKIKRRWEEQ